MIFLRNMLRMAVCGLLALMVAACGTAGISPPAERLAANRGPAEVYKLGVSDKVRMTVFNEPSLSGEFAIGTNGTLSLPLIGDVAAAGQSVEEVTKVVQSKLGTGYLRDPKVNMEVTSYRPFYILGEVKAPGTYPYVNGLTIGQAIAIAEGSTPRADQSVVFVRAAGQDREVAYKKTDDFHVFPGDTIRVGERIF